MSIIVGLIINRLIAYGNERIREFEKDIPPYYTQNRNLLFGNSVHGFCALTMHCKGYTMACTDRIATAVLAHASSEFNFKELKIYLTKDGKEVGFYEFDGDNVAFRPTTFSTKPDSLLTDEVYCNKVEEELKMKEPVKMVFNGGVIFAAPPTIEKIHISGLVTVIIWSDKTKTMVRLQEGEPYDMEKAVYAAIAKKFIGTNKSKSNWLDIIRKKMPDEYHNNAFYGVEKSDIESITQLLKGIYVAHKDEIEELHKAFEEGYNDKTETNGLTNSEPDVSSDDSISGD